MSDTVAETIVEPPPQRLDVPGGSISYRRAGTGRTTVFLHSAGGSGPWGPLYAALAERGDVVIPDHPGFGASDDLNQLRNIDDLVYHYLEVLDRLGIEEYDLVGLSFGGWIAAELAVHSPHRVGKLVLMAPAGLRVPGTQFADLLLMEPPQLIRSLFHDEGLVEAILSAPFDIDAAVQSYRELGALGRFAWNPYLCNPRLAGRLHRITAPTLVVAAGEDRIIPFEHCELYASAIPNARLHVVEDIGHVLDGERPDDVVPVVIDFLNS